MSEHYVSEDRDLEACPSCGSGRICCIVGLSDGLDFCMECHRVWERLPAGEPYTQDGEQLAFKVPCDNCAFRGHSTERAKVDDWKILQDMLAGGGQFYCHKGVPFQVDPNRGRHEGFEFPRKVKTVDIAGEAHPYQHYDTDHMRLCRGYLNAHIAPILKKAIAHDTLPREEPSHG